MSILNKGVGLALTLPLVGGLLPSAAYADPEPQCFYESRSGIRVECGIYKGEVSTAKAYLDTIVLYGQFRKNPSERPVILDVRSIQEYKAGHPKNSYNAPYPYISQDCPSRHPDGACNSSGPRIPQNVPDFVSYVEKIIPNKDTPIYTLCRTGVRSVGAANRLTEAGYTNVYNIWEGFVGVNLKAPQEVVDDDGNPVLDDDGNPVIDDLPVDLNHDGVLDYADLNGWIHHGGLPQSTLLKSGRIYQPYAAWY